MKQTNPNKKECKHKFIKLVYEESKVFGLFKRKQEHILCEKCGASTSWRSQDEAKYY